jgi:hypothetical protein
VQFLKRDTVSEMKLKDSPHMQFSEPALDLSKHFD